MYKQFSHPIIMSPFAVDCMRYCAHMEPFFLADNSYFHRASLDGCKVILIERFVYSVSCFKILKVNE